MELEGSVTDIRSEDSEPVGASGAPDHSNSTEVPGFEERIARREAIKKAAAGAAVAGAVWTAPRVEGLSLVPDYAAAGTATAVIEKTFQIGTADFGNCPGYYCDDPGVAGDGCDNLGDDNYAVANAANPGIVSPSIGPTQNTNIRMDYVLQNAGPSPTPIGNVRVAMAQGADADLPNTDNTRLNVEFSVDPPFNKCRVSAATLEKCGENNLNNLPLNNNPAPGATNPAPGNFTVGVVIPGGPGQGQAEFIRITVRCDP
jgi:hypothetical protein